MGDVRKRTVLFFFIIQLASSFSEIETNFGGDVTRATSSATLNRFFIDNDDKAVCNDGSPSAYYFLDGDPSTWLIYLEGGGWCYDEPTCSSRYAYSIDLMSSNNYGSTIKQYGVFSSDDTESPLSLATKVFVKYCSSDGWGGDVGSDNEDWDTFGWSFRGRRIVDAVMNKLQEDHGLGDVAASVVFGGTSAGGRGAMFNIDRVVANLQITAPLLSVIGLLDSPYWIDIQPLYANLTPMQNQTDQIRLLANISGSNILSPDCSSEHPSELWKCLYGQYRVPYLKAQYLMYAASFDAYQLGQLIGHTPSTDHEISYAENFGAITQTLLQTLPSISSPASSIYSQACYNHAISTSTNFYTTETNDGMTENDALSYFISNSDQPLKDIDNCTSFKCGSGCSQ
jgi:hypothetical protein